MYTEESDIMQLYNTRTHTISPSISVAYHGRGYDIQLYSFTDILKRKGYENILEKYITDEANSTYDYRKIADEQNYKFSNLISKNSIRFALLIGDNQIGFESGTAVLCRKETNSKYAYKIKNLNVTPDFKTDFSVKAKCHKFEIGLEYSHQICIQNNYDVEIKNNAIPHVDFQTCFAPYAYYSAEYDAYKALFEYEYSFEKFSLGTRINGFIINGNRLNDVEYTKTVGYDSVCPMISKQADKHNEKYINMSIYVTF